MTESTSRSRRRDSRARAYCSAVAEAESSSGFPTAAPAAEDGLELPGGRVGEGRNEQPRGLTGGRAEDSRTASVREDRHVASRRQGLSIESGCEIEHLVQRLGANDAGLPEERLHGRVVRDESRRIRLGLQTRRPATRLHHDDRLDPAHGPRDSREPARIPERLEVEKDDPRRLVSLPVLEQVVAGDVDLVPHADEGRDAQVTLPREGEHGETQCAALGHHRDAPAQREGRRDRSVEAHARIGIHQPHGVGTDHAHSVVSNLFEQLLLQGAALGARFRESRRDDDERPDARDGAVVHRFQHRVARRHDDREIRSIRDLPSGREGRPGRHGGQRRARGIDRACESALGQRLENAQAGGGGIAGRAYDREGPRPEERPQRGRREDAVPHLRTGDAVFARSDREIDLDGFILDLRVDRESRLPEGFQHHLVAEESQGPEADEAMARGEKGQTLEKQAAEALALKFVVDGEGDLGARLVARDVGAGRDDPRRAFHDTVDDQRELRARIGRIALPLQERLRRIGRREETPTLRLRGKLMKELAQRLEICRLRRTNERGRPVAEDEAAGFRGVLIGRRQEESSHGRRRHVSNRGGGRSRPLSSRACPPPSRFSTRTSMSARMTG